MRLHGWGGGGKHIFVCKVCGKLGGSGGMLPPLFELDLLLDAIWWNLGLFSHKTIHHLLCGYSFYEGLN